MRLKAAQTTELKTDTLALLDKISLYNFTIESVDDMESLQELGIITVKEKQPHYVVLKSGEYFSTLHIEKTEYFDDFFFGIGKHGVYASMEMSVPDDGFHNLNSLSAAQYIRRIEYAFYFLWKTYGILAGSNNLKYRSMEINKTIILDCDFQTYRRPMVLMMYLLPAKLRLTEADFSEPDVHPEKVDDYNRCISTYTKSSGKKGISVKIYDKKNQLQSCFGILTTHNYCRCEITLKCSTKIIKAFGSNDVDKITDQILNCYFNDFIDDNIVKPYKKHCQKRDIALRKILKDHYAPSSKTWTRDTLATIREMEIKNSVPFMLEISELILQTNCLKIDSKQSRCNLKDRFKKLCTEQNSIFICNDGQKYQELIEKLQL